MTGTLALYNTITVKVDNLEELLKKAGAASKIILYIEGYPFKGIPVRPLGEGTDKLQFDMERADGTEQSWDAMLGRPKAFTKQVTLSLGQENQEPIRSDYLEDKKYTLHVINGFWFFLFVAVFIFSLVLFYKLAKNTAILRDPCPDLKVSEMPFSLGRSQMAFWFFIVIAAYVFIWMVTSNADSLTTEVLTLIGISAGTALGASLVPTTDTDAQASAAALKALTDQRKTLGQEIRQLEKDQAADEATLAQKRDQLKSLNAQIAAMPQVSSGSFLLDIISDSRAISFHRFQIVAWTIVLGIIFVASVYNRLSMPQFDSTLLALMGISSGTYIGFKFNEK